MIGQNKVKENPIGTEKIGRLIFRYAFPSVISMIVNSLYNIVDQIFIGQGVGYLGNGATNVILPITVFGCALGLLLGDGGATYLSLQLGQGRKETASRGVAHVIVGQFTLGILMCIILVIFPLFFGIDGVLYAGSFAVSVSAVIIFFIIFPQIKNIKFSGEPKIGN